MRVLLLLAATILAPGAMSAGDVWAHAHDYGAQHQPLPGWFYVSHPETESEVLFLIPPKQLAKGGYLRPAGGPPAEARATVANLEVESRARKVEDVRVLVDCRDSRCSAL